MLVEVRQCHFLGSEGPVLPIRAEADAAATGELRRAVEKPPLRKKIPR